MIDIEYSVSTLSQHSWRDILHVWGIHNTSRCMMTSYNRNMFRVIGPFAGYSPVTGEFPSIRPVTWRFDIFFDLRLTNQFGDLRRPDTHYDVTVMHSKYWVSHVKLVHTVNSIYFGERISCSYAEPRHRHTFITIFNKITTNVVSCVHYFFLLTVAWWHHMATKIDLGNIDLSRPSDHNIYISSHMEFSYT